MGLASQGADRSFVCLPNPACSVRCGLRQAYAGQELRPPRVKSGSFFDSPAKSSGHLFSCSRMFPFQKNRLLRFFPAVENDILLNVNCMHMIHAHRKFGKSCDKVCCHSVPENTNNRYVPVPPRQ